MKVPFMAEVRLDGVSKSFGKTAAVADLTLCVGDGEFVVLLGPTGAGKTTTLRLVAGLETPDRGQLSISGRDVTRDAPAARDVTFIFQQYSLYPHLSVFDNLAFPLRSPARRFFSSRSTVSIPFGCFSSVRIAASLSARTALSSSKAWRTTIQ